MCLVETYWPIGRGFIAALLSMNMKRNIQMKSVRTGHLHADMITEGGRHLAFRAAPMLEYYELPGLHCLGASNGKDKTFYIYLPQGIESGGFPLGLCERSPMIIHVTGDSETELYRGSLDLMVGGDAQFAGSFRGLDAEGIEVENGSFRLEHASG
ncbi:hypothetical protein D3C76_852490 [compost metagenome]